MAQLVAANDQGGGAAANAQGGGAPKVLALIPARSGSKGVPHKNIRQVGSIPLLAFSIQHAQQSKHVNRILVSTDSDEYASIARSHGAEPVPFTERVSTPIVLRHTA